MEADGRRRCFYKQKHRYAEICPTYHAPKKRCLRFKFDGFAFKVIEIEYWNSTKCEVFYAMWVNVYELPYEEADYAREPDFTIKAVSEEPSTDNELRLDAMNMYKAMVKPLLGKPGQA